METGSFVRATLERQFFYGIAKGFTNPVSDHGGVVIDNYDFGIPGEIYIPDCMPSSFLMGFRDAPKNAAEEISESEYLEHLEACHADMHAKQASRDLAAACWASRQHRLGETMRLIRERKPHYEIERCAEYPKTGIYVVHAQCATPRFDRSIVDPSKARLEGLMTSPRLPPTDVSVILAHAYPKGFNSIRAENQFANGIVLNVGYFTYEIPASAMAFVRDVHIFDLGHATIETEPDEEPPEPPFPRMHPFSS